MPKLPPCLKLRGNTYYMHKRIPADTIDSYGNPKNPFISRSLKTSDLREARKLLNIEMGKLEDEFARRKRAAKQAPQTKKTRLADLTRRQQEDIVLRWLEQEDTKAKAEADSVSGDDVETVIDNLMEEQSHYSLELERREYRYGYETAEDILKQQNIDYSQDHKEVTSLSRLFSQAHVELLKRFIQRLNNEAAIGTGDPLFARLYNLDTAQGGNTLPQQSSLTLKQAITDFMAERMQGGGWTERTRISRVAQFALLYEIFGEDFNIAALDAIKASNVKKTLQSLPKNRNKNSKTRGLSLPDVLKVTGIEKLDTKTINDYLSSYQSLFAWAENQGFVQRNAFGKLNIRQKKGGEKKRNAFTQEQIKIILKALPQYAPEKYKKSYPYWGTLIGIYTGARVNEIAQLALEDIKEEKGIWYFDITNEEDDENEDGNKRLKTTSSKRRVPIHDALLSLGVLEHIEKLKTQKQHRLFPDLNFRANEGGYGRYLSRWFNERFLVKLGIKTKGLSFHSYRHTLVTALLNAGVPLPIAQDIVGHKKAGVTEGVYNSGYNLDVLKAAIDKLDFETDNQHSK